MLEEAFKSKGISEEAEPEKVAVDAGQFSPVSAQPNGPWRDFDSGNFFDSLAVALAMDKAADTTDSFGDKHHLGKLVFFGEFFQAPVDEADGREGFDD